MKKKTSSKEPKSSSVDNVYETEIEYTCPVRGKVKQKVKVKRLPAVEASHISDVLPSNNIAEKLDIKYSGLLMSDDSLEDEKDN